MGCLAAACRQAPLELPTQFLRNTLAGNIRVLYTSGYTENTIVHRGVVDDDVDFLAKPYVSGELAQRLRDVLDRPTR
jgi:PleD family two-component response regulator